MNFGFTGSPPAGGGSITIEGATWEEPYGAGLKPALRMTRVGGWLTISNKETSDYPAPVANNTPAWGLVPDPTWTTSQLLGDLAYGYDFTATQMFDIRGWRIWDNGVLGEEYVVQLFDYNNPNNPILLASQVIDSSGTSGWVEVLADDADGFFVVFPNSRYRISVTVHSTTNDVPYSGIWRNVDGGDVPSSGDVTLNTDAGAKVFISKTETDSGPDRSADLLILKEDDIILFTEVADVSRFGRYRVTGGATDQGTYIEIPVVQQDGGKSIRNNRDVTTDWVVYGADTNTNYVTVPNAIPGTYFPSDNVQGFLTGTIDDITDPALPLNKNIYGVDLLGDSYTQSEDWDIMAYSGGSSAGSTIPKVLEVEEIRSVNGNVSLVITDTTDDRGMAVKGGQFSVGTWDDPRETCLGQGDSTTETMLAYHTDDDISFTDVTDILASDTGSTTPMFNGTTAGKTIYVGADFTFTGVKAKIDTDGLIEASNVSAEYWDGSQWQKVNYMATNANRPYQQYGWELAQHGHPSEQWRFNFDPYLQYAEWQKNTVNGVEKFWARFRILSDISTDPILEQIKLHTSRWECNSDGVTEYFGGARYKKTILSGVNNLVNNAAQSPANESVDYAPGVTAGYTDNQFNNNAVDSRLFILNIDEGLDTSVPIEVSVSWYIDGNATGDVEFKLDKIPVTDGFIYDGNASVEIGTSSVTSVLIPSDLRRQSTRLLLDIEEAQLGGGFVLVLTRDARGSNPNDTVQNNIILTHIVVNGYFWRP